MVDRTQESAPPPISRFMAAALGKHAGLDHEETPLFQQLVEELTAALLQGHICIAVNEEQRHLLRRSRVVAENRRAPLVLSGGRLYFGRYFGYESELAESLKNLATAAGPSPEALTTVTGRISKAKADAQQQRAVTIALNNRFCIISGGPGTGKTTLIVAIIADLLVRHGPDLRIALAAPTGKAALRMQESIRMQLGETQLEPSVAARFPAQSMTLHRLLELGRRAGWSGSRSSEPLDYDVVVVDEASMVDLAMMWRLVRALKKNARLLLLGDRNQLASVESGAVLADCIDSLPDNVAELTKSYRFNEAIAHLADTVKSGAADEAWSFSSSSGGPAVSIAPPDWLDRCTAGYREFVELAAKTTDPTHFGAVFEQYNQFRILCALRQGPHGSEEINRRIERTLVGIRPTVDGEHWYPGKPVLITRNDYNLGLYNGDIGICLPDSEGGALRLWFEAADGTLKKYLPAQIPLYDPAWALTIHKSQGSEFQHVMVVLPERDNRVLCRELLYTAVTRARQKVVVVAREDIFKTAVKRKTVRSSGLAERLT
jgi:exodeoxyribonuclease V alpha subunit